ncbi:MAG: isoprenyl transferase [Acidaminococcaceae bacterium]|jgi:undecaprenyl diphosphate synthase|nr:isoprenyl transferase [Acidaminococcaceae bacterium]MBO6266352.1 isoprenyl transferase [Acidaminococcaceae bacterium]MBP3264580.1 isoprenyl transferase [Acidaminococcaceae bacterium]MBQ5344594.1 isoprenyl transferase [Acidaminococcaceae bacterium]MBQ7419083.1 isoprenyl transferase [Acidaminococcaceae bacterium]
MFKGLFQRPVRSMPSAVTLKTDGLDMTNIPKHVAIIMDGNGRWAKAQGKARTYGHKAGAETLKTIVRAADTLGIKAITAYAFSTENWKRPVTEVHFIMELLSRYLTSEIEDFKANNVQVRFMGSREGLPAIVNEKMDHAIDETKNDTGIILNLAINYGGQAEILHAVRSIAQQVANGTLNVEDIDAPVFENNLYSKGLPSPDLMIRTGGDLRVSNFLLWQIAYSEIWTTPVYWPDFSPDMLIEAIKVYQSRERRFGGLVQK